MTTEERVKTVDTKPSKLRKFLYGLSWTVIWPLVVAAPAFVVMLVILGAVLTNNIQNKEFSNAVSTQGIFLLELYLFGFVALLVIVLYLVKWLLQTRKRLFFRSGAKVLGVYIWVGIFATGLTMAIITRNPEAIKPPVSRDETIVAILHSVGGKDELIDNVSIKYVDSYNNATTNGEYQPVVNSDGTFSYGTITVKKGIDPTHEKTVVAHEYLHHIWQSQLDQQTLHDLTSQLMTLYGNDSWIKDRTNWYSDTNMLLPTELFSFYCTEVADQHLSQYVFDTCNKYIDRSALTFTRT
ncbi:hypothetical protein EOM33_00895 [Candidatus Saccharibacteria bacterium]|nr:hypothetical protein [Candidatus Saccharibacteria bacterium]